MSSVASQFGPGEPRDFADPDEYHGPWPDWEPQSFSSSALSASAVASSVPCRFIGATIFNSKASAQFILLFDLSALPANGTVANAVFTVATVANLGLYFGTSGRWMYRGLVLVNSSTEPTLTIGSADCHFDVQYVPQVV